MIHTMIHSNWIMNSMPRLAWHVRLVSHHITHTWSNTHWYSIECHDSNSARTRHISTEYQRPEGIWKNATFVMRNCYTIPTTDRTTAHPTPQLLLIKQSNPGNWQPWHYQNEYSHTIVFHIFRLQQQQYLRPSPGMTKLFGKPRRYTWGQRIWRITGRIPGTADCYEPTYTQQKSFTAWELM